MDFFAAVERRRSVRRYTATPVPTDVIEKAIQAALLAPNSSNMQTWRIYHVKTAHAKKSLIHACLNQGAARSAQELFVFTVDPSAWRITQQAILNFEAHRDRADIKKYYAKLVPIVYGWLWLAPLKWIGFNLYGIFKPMMRGPNGTWGIQEVCVKSCALACENFMLAIAAQGFDSCPMEGFDSWRVRRLLKASYRESVVMVISVGERDPRGVWGERFRIPRDIVFREI
jgi:nitroreductase